MSEIKKGDEYIDVEVGFEDKFIENGYEIKEIYLIKNRRMSL